MRDQRIDKLADVLVNYSVRCQKGEKVLIEGRGIDAELIKALVEKVYEAGGFPFVEVVDLAVERAPFARNEQKTLANCAPNTINTAWRTWIAISACAAAPTRSNFPTYPPKTCRCTIGRTVIPCITRSAY